MRRGAERRTNLRSATTTTRFNSMADAKTTPGGEEKKLNADGTPAADSKKDEAKEPKVGEIIEDADKGTKKTPNGDDDAPKTVGLDKFLEEKKARKAAEKRIAELESKGEEVDADDVSDAIDEIAEEYNVDKGFLKKLKKVLTPKSSPTKSTEDKTKEGADDEVSSRLTALEQKERDAEIAKAFDSAYKKALEIVPEYAEVANPEVIKELSLLPKNKDKTFSQIIEETYGKSVPTGRKTIERTTPGGGKEPETVDFDRARKDSKYYAEIMANPALKKQYNDGLEKRLPL